MGKGQDLLEAARKGDEKSVEKILLQAFKRSGPFPSLRRTPVVNVKDDSGYTPLHHASLQGHREIVRQLLSCDANPCLTNDKGATPLHLAAFKGDGEIVAMLLAHNNPPVNVNQVTLANETALVMAAQFGSVNVVTQLLNKGADVNIRNVKDESALDLAAQYGRLKTVKRLIKMHPSLVHPYKLPNWRVRNFSNTPLHRASKNGHDDVVAVLLAAGIDPNIRTTSGTPLHEAACFGKATVVQILLDAGADLNALDGSKKTVEDLLADYSEEATRKVRRVIREYKSRKRNNYESEDDVPPFPIQDSPTISIPSGMKAPETQKSNNISDSLLTPSPSFLTKNPPQNFVKKLASKCLNLKAKFNSAPNISNPGLESHVDGKLKHSDSKLIGNSKFFKILSKKEESGDIDCTDEFDTISLDRLGTLNRDSTVNRSNRSCPGFKTSLPNISENNELSDSSESIPHEYVETSLDCDKNGNKKGLSEAVNYNIFEPRHNSSRKSAVSNISTDSANLVNECYESYQFSHTNLIEFENSEVIPTAPPRSTLGCSAENTDVIYENVIPEKCRLNLPTPAVRTHIPTKIPGEEVERINLYENIAIRPERKAPDPPKRSFLLSNVVSNNSSPSVSRSSTLSSDSMIDESNLEDILLSEKSKSFRHGKKLVHRSSSKSTISIHRTQSNASDVSDVTEVSAIENVDCSENVDNKSIYLTMTGTLPNKKIEKVTKKVLFRHKTFTNMEIDRNSISGKNTIKYDGSFLKETLGNYHIRGTGHCIYKSPTVQEFIYIFNRDNLCPDAEPFIKMPNEKRDSYFETAICFCKPRPPKRHNSAEDLLDVQSQEEEEKVSIDVNAIRNKMEFVSSSFRCFCESGICPLHVNKRESPIELVVKFSAIKKSISTPDITLKPSPFTTVQKSGLNKIKSVPLLEEPYAVVNVQDVIKRNENNLNDKEKQYDDVYVAMSPHSSLSSTDRPYSIKDISEVISIGTNSTSTDTNTSHASDSILLRKSSSSEHSGHWSLQTCNSNITIVSDASFKTCLEESEDSDGTLHSDGESSDAETVKSDVSISKRPWVNSSSFRFGKIRQRNEDSIDEEFISAESTKFESGISVGSESSSSESEVDSGVPGESDVPVESSDVPGGFISGGCNVSLDASLCSGLGDVRSGSGRRRWEEMEGTSEGDALSISSAASSCAPLHLAHHHEYSKVSPTPPKKPPRRNLSVSPTHVNSPSSGYSYELRTHARSQDDLDEIQGAKHYLKHGRSVDQYVDSKLSYSEYEENHNSPRAIPVPNPRPSLKNRTQPVAITAMYENVVIKEQNPRRKLRRNTFGPQYENYEPRMDKRVRKYSNQERSSLESLLDDQISPSECDKCDGPKIDVPLSPSHYEQPPTPDHPPPSAKQAENSIHERIRPLSQRIMEVVEEIRVRNKSQGDVHS